MVCSKNYQTFSNRMLHFDDDLEYVDIIHSSVRKNMGSFPNDVLFENINSSKHPRLSRYKICDDNRLKVVQHFRATVYAAYIKELYEEFSLYLKSTMSDMYLTAKVTPDRLVGEHKVNLSANDILRFAANGTIAQVVIDNIFQSLENERSTISLITKICKKLDLNVDKAVIDNAVYYLEIRHKLVHTDGFADAEFKASHPTLCYTNRGYIILTYQCITAAKNAVFELVKALDQNAIDKEYLLPYTVK